MNQIVHSHHSRQSCFLKATRILQMVVAGVWDIYKISEWINFVQSIYILVNLKAYSTGECCLYDYVIFNNMQLINVHFYVFCHTLQENFELQYIFFFLLLLNKLHMNCILFSFIAFQKYSFSLAGVCIHFCWEDMLLNICTVTEPLY